MLNYKKMTAKEAIRAAKEESGLTAEQIARRLNVSTSVIRRYLKEDDNYFPGLEMLPRLCLVLGSGLIIPNEVKTGYTEDMEVSHAYPVLPFRKPDGTDQPFLSPLSRYPPCR